MAATQRVVNAVDDSAYEQRIRVPPTCENGPSESYSATWMAVTVSYG